MVRIRSNNSSPIVDAAANDNLRGFTTGDIGPPLRPSPAGFDPPVQILGQSADRLRSLEDDASGLVYMHARYYDPLMGRFLSTDPIGYQDPLNLYAYVHNDPVNATDPDGQYALAIAAAALRCGASTACRSAAGFVIGGAVGAAANAYSEVTDGQKGFNRDRFVAKTTVDAVTGAALGARPDKAGAISAAGGAAKAVAVDAIEGDLSVVETSKSVATEAISAALGGKGGSLAGGLTGSTLADDAAGAAAGAAASTRLSGPVSGVIDTVTSGPPPARLPPKEAPDIRSGFQDPCASRQGSPNCQ